MRHQQTLMEGDDDEAMVMMSLCPAHEPPLIHEHEHEHEIEHNGKVRRQPNLHTYPQIKV